MRQGEAAFVDSGAWIALALLRDPLHARAREQWDALHASGAKLHCSVPVLIETFTFLERNANRDVALAWKESIYKPGTVKILSCELRDLELSWEYFRRTDSCYPDLAHALSRQTGRYNPRYGNQRLHDQAMHCGRRDGVGLFGRANLA